MVRLWGVVVGALVGFALGGQALAQDQDAIANKLLIEAVTGSGSPIVKRRLLSAIVEEFPETTAAQSIQAGVVSLPNLPEDPAWQQLLIEGSQLTGHGHGSYPSFGPATHPGIDIGLPGPADCGLEVRAPRTGVIRRIVALDVPDEDLAEIGIDRARNIRDHDRNTGNAVFLRHDDVDPAVFSIYLHLKDAPARLDGEKWRLGETIKAGQRIGLVGESGNADGCHLHFEARRFEGTYRYLHPTYGNIYPLGDISKSATFQSDWIDPAAFLRRSFIAAYLTESSGTSGGSPSSRVADLPEPDLPGTHANSTAQTASGGRETVAEAAEPNPTPDPGAWILQTEPRRRIGAGTASGDLAMGADGSATYRGQALFQRASGGDALELRVFVSPKARHALVLQWDKDLGGKRAALIDLPGRRILRADLIPESAVRGSARPRDSRVAMGPVAWSPDGRYLGFPMSPAEWEASPFFVDTQSGVSATAVVDDLKEGQWAFPKFETLRSDSADWIEIAYDVMACADADCSRPTQVGSVQGGHRISALLTRASAQSADLSAPRAPATWGPALVASVNVGYNPCRNGAEKAPTCLRALGLSDEAIAFSFARDGDYSGSSVGSEFRELGAVDLAVSQFIGNTYYFTPMLVNGPAGFTEIGFTRDMNQAFRDDASQRMLRQFPRATNIGGLSIRSHRRLADGTQRFALSEIVMDGCRACDILGSALSFIDIGPATGQRLVRRPVGLLLDDPGQSEDMTAAVLRNRPESLQVMLNTLGYDAGPMDGFAGPQTRRALMSFQVEHCLPPTGQPDQATAAALLKADGFQAPCAGAALPDGLEANAPLLAGVYVDDPALCAGGAGPVDQAHLRQRLIRGSNITFGWEGVCTPRRTDIHNGVTLYRGTCSEANGSTDASWRFDVLSSDRFVDLDMPGAVAQDRTPRTYTKCADDSPLRATFARWFGEDSVAAISPANPLPFEQGVYTTDTRLCPPADPEFLASLGVAAPTYRIDFKDGVFTQRDQTCPVTGIEGSGPDTTLVMDCVYGEKPVSFRFKIGVRGRDRFTRNGLDFRRCATVDVADASALGQTANSTPAVLPADSAEGSGSPPEMPDFREIIDGLDYVGATDKAATTELIQTVFTLLAKMEPDGSAELLGISAKGFAAEFLADPEAMLAVVGADIVVSAGEAVFAEAAGDIVAGYMFASVPLSRLPEAWQVPLRALVDATIVESVGLLATGANPTPAALVGPIVDRLHDVHEIYQATNTLSRAQASGLFAVANGAEITAELVRRHPGPRSDALRTSWFALTRENLKGIVGADDATAAFVVTLHGYRALDALAMGDRAKAEAEVAKMRAVGQANEGLTPLSAEGPIDLLVRIASGGKDAPLVLVETFLKATALRELHPDVAAEEANRLAAQAAAEAKRAGWRGKPNVVQTLREIAATYPAQGIGGCARAHGPIAVPFRQRLFIDATATILDRSNRRTTRPITQQMIEGDRFCLHPNNAQCAASNYQLYYCASGEMVFVNPGSAFAGPLRVIDVVERPRNPIMTGRVDAVIYGRDQRDIKAVGTGCALSSGWSEPNQFRWNGSCEGGRATGSGTIEWMKGPEVIWRTHIGPKWGLSLDDGVIRYDIDLDAFDIRLSTCNRRIAGYRAVEILAPTSTPRAFFENSWVSSELMRRGALFAQSECPVEDKGLSNIVVEVTLGGTQMVRGRNYDKSELTWREFTNQIERAMLNELKTAERNRQANERQRIAQARANALAAQFRLRRDEIVARANRFTDAGRGTMDDLAAALELDHIRTLERLERGAKLILGPVEGLATVTHNGARHYQVSYGTTSPFQRLEREFRSQQGFSWENWMALTQSGLPSQTRVSCLYPSIGRIPQDIRDVSLELVNFSRGSSATQMTFVCR